MKKAFSQAWYDAPIKSLCNKPSLSNNSYPGVYLYTVMHRWIHRPNWSKKFQLNKKKLSWKTQGISRSGTHNRFSQPCGVGKGENTISSTPLFQMMCSWVTWIHQLTMHPDNTNAINKDNGLLFTTDVWYWLINKLIFNRTSSKF